MSEEKKDAPARIEPTVGRVVLYYPKGIAPPTQPCRADVCFVHPDGRINIAWNNADGVQQAATAVYLVQPGEEPPKSGHYAFWMPYQVGQAVAHSKLGQSVDDLEGKHNQILNFVRGEADRQAKWRGQTDMKLDEFRWRMSEELKKHGIAGDVRYPTGFEQDKIAKEKEAAAAETPVAEAPAEVPAEPEVAPPPEPEAVQVPQHEPFVAPNPHAHTVAHKKKHGK